ncbi:hypothetical protein DFP72DRAFT_873239 [Ephemerocybe angulata]|uniref:Uncharacterized protein n=1 Tax=Ephemerocybe angulata TaxID=980116 RepID=A0A8H6MCR5_9AGAR|nr:hypothetical protein DFP72DRAFT_873239 [Tulosesus angulatus]
MEAPILPQEILDEITDCVAIGDPETLKGLSLTSNNHFLDRARSHLFGTLHIFTDIPPKTLTILEENPTLFKYVRNIDIKFDFVSPEHVDLQTTLSRVVDHLTGLHKLNLTCHFYLEGTPWREFSPVSQVLIAKLIAYPISHLSLAGFLDFPNQLLPPFHDLLRLEVGAFTSFSPTDAEYDGELTWRLKFLLYASSGHDGIPLLSFPCMRPAYSTLVIIDLHLENMEQHVDAWAFLQEIGELGDTALEIINLLYTQPLDSRHNVSECFYESIRAGRTLPSFPSLRYLGIDHTAHRHTETFGALSLGSPFLPYFPSSVLTKTALPLLEVLNVNFLTIWHGGVFMSTQLVALRLGEEDYPGWDQLDLVLSDKCTLPRLQAARLLTVHKYHKNRSGPSLEEGKTLKEVCRKQRAENPPPLPKAGACVPLVDIGLEDTCSLFDKAARNVLRT